MRACLGFVAGAAVDKIELFRVSPALTAGQVRVAFHASQAWVNGCCASVFGHEDRYLFVPAVARQVRLGVTPEALLIFLCQCGAWRQQEDRGHCEEPALPMTPSKEPGTG